MVDLCASIDGADADAIMSLDSLNRQNVVAKYVSYMVKMVSMTFSFMIANREFNF